MVVLRAYEITRWRFIIIEEYVHRCEPNSLALNMRLLVGKLLLTFNTCNMPGGGLRVGIFYLMFVSCVRGMVKCWMTFSSIKTLFRVRSFSGFVVFAFERFGFAFESC